MEQNNRRVLVAMSGGVDSSVAAWLLLEQARNMGQLEERAHALNGQAQRLREMSTQEDAT